MFVLLSNIMQIFVYFNTNDWWQTNEIMGSEQLCGVFCSRLDTLTAYLVFILELLHRTKLQQTHVDQLLQVLVKCEDVFPDFKNAWMLNLESQSRWIVREIKGEEKQVTVCTAAASSSWPAALGQDSVASRGRWDIPPVHPPVHTSRAFTNWTRSGPSTESHTCGIYTQMTIYYKHLYLSNTRCCQRWYLRITPH